MYKITYSCSLLHINYLFRLYGAYMVSIPPINMGVAGIAAAAAAAAEEDLHSQPPAAIAGDYLRMIKWRLSPGYIHPRYRVDRSCI